jgi:signal transduction histidine kinase
MKQLSVRQWLLVSWLLCLGLPRLLFEAAQRLQHAVAPSISGPGWILGPLSSALLTAGLTLLGVGWLTSRWLLAPLAALERAARQIARGDTEVVLPRSRVREVNEVAVAFAAMGDGLRAAVRRQAALEQERRVLIGAVAHDLRTPLFALRGYLAGIEQGVAATPERVAHYLAVCRTQAAALDQRISALFDYARLDLLAQPPLREPVRWDALARQTVERLWPAAEQRRIALRLADPPAPCALDGDPQMLSRMLDNLVENAVRHTPPGGAVVVAWEVAPGQLRFRVTDSGQGIAPEDLPYVFVPLYRGRDGQGRAPEGAGLGLATALRIAQMHGGGLRAENRPEGGAALLGWLPLGARAAGPAAAPADGQE